MGWRDLLEAAAEEVDFGTMEYDGPAQLLLAMPAPDRIALARELLAGTGRVDVRVVGVSIEHFRMTSWEVAHSRGWNACRAAMMEEKDE